MSTKAFPFQWQELSPEEKAKLKEGYPVSALNDMVRYDNGILMAREFEPVAEQLYNFELRDDDIWIVTFPKAGTTWTQEMVWMLVNNVDKEKGAMPASLRVPYMEINSLMGPDIEKIPFPPDMIEVMNDPIGYAGKMSSPRVLKTHLPIDSLPHGALERCRIVYVARNPKDVCVSFFKMMSEPESGFVGDFSQFAEFFKSGLQVYGDYWHHILSGWQVRERENVMFLWFEDMKKDQRKVIEDLITFLKHPLTDSQKDSLVDHLKFENMKANPNANPMVGMEMESAGNFFRKGEVGNWKKFFTPEKAEEWARWIEEKTAGTGLSEKIPPF